MKIFAPFLFLSLTAAGQSTSPSLPWSINPANRYLFYLHGAVVSELGNNAINPGAPEWGPYEYLNILDSLRSRGFCVVSEIRRKDIPDSAYAQIIVRQIDSLLQQGVPVGNIVVVGASSGWNIVLLTSTKINNKDLHFVAMGGCWPDTYKDYLQFSLRGHFLSIVEKSDPHGSCDLLFLGHIELTSYREIFLHTGLSHGFLYKGYREWIDPIIAWIGGR
jgi:hypothetical protein